MSSKKKPEPAEPASPVRVTSTMTVELVQPVEVPIKLEHLREFVSMTTAHVGPDAEVTSDPRSWSGFTPVEVRLVARRVDEIRHEW